MTGMLSQSELESLVAAGDIDTVIVAFCDMQGRLTGKRVSARLFVDDVAEHGAECCNYLLAVDVDMNTVDGYAISSWETGYGDMVMTPDFATLRLIPWLPGTALVMADLWWTDGRPVTQAPRSILNRQIERLSERGLVPYVGTELEFMVFDDGFREAWAKGYRGLTPATDYNVDYAMLASTRMEPLLRDIRLGMEGAGMYCEGVKGECNYGQQEIAFRYDHARLTCDNHTIYKNGAKEIADKHGKSLTFMAKFDEREGNSCHIHISLRGDDGTQFLSQELVAGLTGRPSLYPDRNIFVPLSFHLGFHSVPFPPGFMPGFGHAGLAGSVGWADSASGLSFAFVHNRLLTRNGARPGDVRRIACPDPSRRSAGPQAGLRDGAGIRCALRRTAACRRLVSDAASVTGAGEPLRLYAPRMRGREREPRAAQAGEQPDQVAAHGCLQVRHEGDGDPHDARQ